MSIPTTLEALLIIVLVFVPGMILIQMLRSTISFYPPEHNLWHFFSMGAVGLALHVPMFLLWTHFLVDWYRDNTLPEHWINATLWVLFVLLVWPLLVGECVMRLVQKPGVDRFLDRYGMGQVDRTPSAWDWALSTSETRWVKIRLIDGEWIGGWFGNQSFAALRRGSKDIYLERARSVDRAGNIGPEDPNTDGVWVSHSQIQMLMLQRGQDTPAEEVIE